MGDLIKVDEANWGLSAARSRMNNKVDPEGKVDAWDKFFPSFARDIRNGNELINRVQHIEGVLARRPF